MHRLLDPLGRFSWRVTGYAWLTVFFARLWVWYLIEDRKGS